MTLEELFEQYEHRYQEFLGDLPEHCEDEEFLNKRSLSPKFRSGILRVMMQRPHMVKDKWRLINFIQSDLWAHGAYSLTELGLHINDLAAESLEDKRANVEVVF